MALSLESVFLKEASSHFRGTKGSTPHFCQSIRAVARKLLIALWRFLETGVLPAGAVLKEG
jgi:hypothetical protein